MVEVQRFQKLQIEKEEHDVTKYQLEAHSKSPSKKPDALKGKKINLPAFGVNPVYEGLYEGMSNKFWEGMMTHNPGVFDLDPTLDPIGNCQRVRREKKVLYEGAFNTEHEVNAYYNHTDQMRSGVTFSNLEIPLNFTVTGRSFEIQ